jgi:SAM-dependent methyltransferase
MEHKGMVHALEGIERLLRPGGRLIDIHPVLGAPLVEVHEGGGVAFAESSPSYDYEEDLRQAEHALASIVERGMFVTDRGREFDFLTYGPSVAELRDFMAEAGAYDDRPEDSAVVARKAELYARIDEVMRASGDRVEVAFHEKARMARLTPVR